MPCIRRPSRRPAFAGTAAVSRQARPRPHRRLLPLLNAEGDVRPLDEIEADLIRYAMSHYRGQMSEVARRLQIGRSTLYRKLEALGLGEGGDRRPKAVAAERQPRKIA